MIHIIQGDLCDPRVVDRLGIFSACTRVLQEPSLRGVPTVRRLCARPEQCLHDARPVRILIRDGS
jgi:hypothetical protein